jgi:ABC-type cobalt transport system substrate-binding protein
MLMNPSKDISSAGGSSDGISNMALAIGGFAIVFLVVLLLAGLVTDKEEGSFASADISAKEYVESIDADIESIVDAELND